VEIRTKRGFPHLLGKLPPKSGVTFPHSHRRYWLSSLNTKISMAIEKIQVAHPGPNPVIGIATKQFQFGRGSQDAIEDYSESGTEVQVLCLQIHKVVGIGWRVEAHG
jgi:hypothetical protein